MGKYLIITEHLISIWNICHDILNSQFNEIFFEKLKKNVFFFPFFFCFFTCSTKASRTIEFIWNERSRKN